MTQLQSSSLFSEDTIEPSSSISQIFTNHDDSRTEISFLANTSSPPLNLDFKCVAKHRKIIPYPAFQEKILIFHEWWQTTSFSQARVQAQKPPFHFAHFTLLGKRQQRCGIALGKVHYSQMEPLTSTALHACIFYNIQGLTTRGLAL
ncbi:hypothetical protein BDW66DRAFT_28413 [Aspergillus desertorum]